MSIREIDDRYPEFARPYEPIKGGRRFKRLGAPASLLLALAGAAVILTGALSPKAEPPREVPQPVVTAEPTAAPTAAPTPSPTPDPVLTPLPTAEPTPMPTATPSPSPSPSPTPTPTPVPAPIYYPPVYTPTPSPSPVTLTEPTVSLSHLYYWDQIDHVEAAYTITANDADSIVSWAEVTSMADPSLHFSVSSLPGGGTVTANEDVYGLMEPRSADAWKTDVTLNYTLGGEAKTKTVTLTASPEYQGLLTLYDIGTSSSGAADAKAVTANLGFYYPGDYRHSFTPAFTAVKLGWMDNSYTKVAESDIRTVWDGTGVCPVSGPIGPTADGSNMVLKYTYAGTVDATPTAAALAAGATHFYLIFEMGGVAVDTADGMSYSIRNPDNVQSYPQPLAAYTEPTVSFSHLWYWGEFNSTPYEYGLRHLEAEYVITPNDADPGSISSDIKVISDLDSSRYVEKTGIPYTGTVDVNWNTGGVLWRNSVERWGVEIHVDYTVGGSPMTLDLTVPPAEPSGGYRLTQDYSYNPGSSTTVTFTTGSGDRHIYSLSFSRVEIVWVEDEGGGWYSPVGTPTVVWVDTDPDRFTYVGTTDDGTHKVITYAFDHSFIDFSSLSIPADATHFRFDIYAGGSATDPVDSTVYPHNGYIPDYSFNYYPIP